MGKKLISLVSTESSLTCHGMRSLSSLLRQHGHQTRLIFLNSQQYKYSHRTLTDLCELVSDSDLIGIFCYSQGSMRAVQVTQALKELEIPTVWSGDYATLTPETCLNYVDIVCIGEGEGAILELVESLDDKDKIKTIKNLRVKENGHIYKNELRPLISNLDELPYEDYDFSSQYILKRNGRLVRYRRGYLGAQEYRRLLRRQGLTGFSISLSRGCPFSCFFCSNYDFQMLYAATTENRVRRKSIKAAIAELCYYRETINYRFNFISFDDGEFFTRPLTEIEEFCATYKREIGILFAFHTHVQSFDEEKLKLLIDAGLRVINVGIHSLSDRTKKEAYERNLLNAKAIETSRLLNSYRYIFFRPPTYHIVNTNPYETREDVYKRIDLIESLPKPFIIHIFYLRFLPNSYLTKKSLSDGLLSEKEKLLLAKGCYGIFSYAERRKFIRYEWFLLGLLAGGHISSRMGFISKRTFGLLMNKKVVWFFERNMFLMRLLRYLTFLYPQSPRFVLSPFFRRIP